MVTRLVLDTFELCLLEVGVTRKFQSIGGVLDGWRAARQVSLSSRRCFDRPLSRVIEVPTRKLMSRIYGSFFSKIRFLSKRLYLVGHFAVNPNFSYLSPPGLISIHHFLLHQPVEPVVPVVYVRSINPEAHFVATPPHHQVKLLVVEYSKRPTWMPSS